MEFCGTFEANLANGGTPHLIPVTKLRSDPLSRCFDDPGSRRTVWHGAGPTLVNFESDALQAHPIVDLVDRERPSDPPENLKRGLPERAARVWSFLIRVGACLGIKRDQAARAPRFGSGGACTAGWQASLMVSSSSFTP